MGRPPCGQQWRISSEPGKIILKDIRQWRDVIKKPDLSHVDWEAMAKKDLKKACIYPEETAIVFHMHVGYFQNLMAFMGFENGLCAMYEEPEGVLALLDMLSDFYCEMLKKVSIIINRNLWV